MVRDSEYGVIRRFKIEDIILQDDAGVVFRALDAETGRMAAVRRFFPFGAKGGGLMQDEQTAYNIALDRLAGLHHPALRSVICGGCDPVDGIPFIATEWIDGIMLDDAVRQRPLSADIAAEVLTKALEVCELLSHVLAEEAVWVETDLSAIVLGDEKSGRGFTFWISPLKWLGGVEHPRGLESIIALAEELMDWKGRPVNDQAGGGLGLWLQWLRHAAPTTTLREARENLAAAIGIEPPPAARKLVVEAARPSPPKPFKVPMLAGLGLALIITGFAGWLLNRKKPEPPHVAKELTGIPAVNRRAAEFHEQLLRADREKEAILEAQRTAVAKRGGVFSPAESELLVTQKGRSATLEGRVAKTGFSDSGKTFYLYFSEKPTTGEVRGAISSSVAGSVSETPPVGKTIRITGKVAVVRGRPEIIIANPAAITTAG